MKITKYDPAAARREYGILCRRIYPAPGAPTPFGSTWCTVEPGGRTDPHHHADGETFYIVSGAGRMVIGDEAGEMAAGDVVWIPPGSTHVLENRSASEPLVFVSVYWDPPVAPVAPRTLVISAPPTPNGDLHLGHLSGPYVAADVHARYLRMRGSAVVTLCGTDDNQSYTAVKAKQQYTTPGELAGRFGDMCFRTLEATGVTVDRVVRPLRDAGYVTLVQRFFAALVERGHVVERDAPSAWCPQCDRYVHEAHVSGKCPHCGAGTNGNGCEACGHTNDCADLVNPTCNACKTRCELRATRRFYFPLGRHRAALEAYHARASLSPRLRALAGDAIRRGLPDISVSHLSAWGIPVPGREGHVLYEWFEMAAGYAHAAGDLLRDPSASTVLFFGFDNAFFYTCFIPALLAAYDPALKLPDGFESNEFFRLDGLKFSTSRNHAIWGPEALAHVPADVVRFALAHERPETAETSFSLAAFEALVGEKLGAWDRWLDALSARCADLDGRAPEERPAGDAHARFHAHLQARGNEIAACYTAGSFSLRRAARLLHALVEDLAEFGASHAFAKDRAALALELAGAAVLARAAAPLMPDFARTLSAALGHTGAPAWDADAPLLPAGTRLGELPRGTFAAALRGVDALIQQRGR